MAGYPLSAGNYIARVTPGNHLLGKSTQSVGIVSGQIDYLVIFIFLKR